MNNTQLDPGLSAMLDGTNFPIDPGALIQQQPLFETDNSSSRTTSTSSVPRISTPDTDPSISNSGDDKDSEKEVEEEPQDYFTSKKPSTRTRKATSKMPTSKSRTGAASKSKRASGGTTNSGNTTTTTSTRGGGAAEKRRKRNLERNRAAASKCRQRKKQWQDGLERRKMELESRYKALTLESKELMDEVTQLKNLVMAHATCNDPNIDDWIRNEADSFVRRMSTANLHDQQQYTVTSGSSAPSARDPRGDVPMNGAYFC